MKSAGDFGEPAAPGRHDRRAAERQAYRDAIWFAVVFGGVVLANALLGLLLLEVFGTTDVQPSGADGATSLP